MSDSVTRVGLTYDLRDTYLEMGYTEDETAEFDRADTIDSIEGALVGLGYEVDRIGHIKELAARLVAGDRWDLVFNICEGMHGIGREAQVPGLLDAWQQPYVFSDTVACALTLHKAVTKDVVRAAGIATPDYAIVQERADIERIDLPFPLFAKPVGEGTGKGITAQSKITDVEQLERVCAKLLKDHRQPVLVERFLPGREFTVGVLGTGSDARAVATLEIELLDGADADVYSYRNKEECERFVRYTLLAEGELREEIESLCVDAWRALGCRDAGRIDVRLDGDGHPHFLEVNPLAGIHPNHSDLPIMAAMSGMAYEALIDAIMKSAEKRCLAERRADTLAA